MVFYFCPVWCIFEGAGKDVWGCLVQFQQRERNEERDIGGRNQKRESAVFVWFTSEIDFDFVLQCLVPKSKI